MIISPSHKFIFIHNPKAAGTSIRRALIPYGNCIANTKHETIEQFVVRTQFDITDFTLFGVVRNPWDRFSSFYSFLQQRAHVIPEISTVSSLAEFATRIDEDWLKNRYSIRPQCEYFNAQTTIIRYENLNNELPAMFEQLGIDATITHSNKSSAHDFRKEFDTRSYDIIAAKYAKDIRLYDY